MLACLFYQDVLVVREEQSGRVVWNVYQMPTAFDLGRIGSWLQAKVSGVNVVGCTELSHHSKASHSTIEHY